MSAIATQPAPTRAANSTWQIDSAHTQVGFGVKHMMFAKVRGRFGAVEGTLELGGDDVSAAKVEAVIQAASIDTAQAQRDAHLRSPDFFDVERFPELRFRSASVRRSGPDGFVVSGDLTIRDVTRRVELAVVRTGQGLDPDGNLRAGYNATTTVDRRDFGLTWNQALETGGILVGNEVEIELEVQAVLAVG